MSDEIVNSQEFKIAGEVLPMIKIRLKKIKGRIFNGKNKSTDKKRVLVVNTCIIGDFLATLPALRTFVEKNKTNVDMIVSPAVKSLAESVKGINKVFVAKSSYKRGVEKNYEVQNDLPKNYNAIIVLRISPEAYRLIKGIDCSEIITCDLVYFKYISHVLKNILLNKPVKQSREIIFEIFDIKNSGKNLDSNHIFNFTKSDYESVKKIPEMKGNEKKVLIHTGSGWKVKLWQDEKWVDLLKKINDIGKFKFVFIGATDEERKSFENIKKKLNFKVHSLIGKIDLKELVLIMKNSDYFIGIDSGPRNMAHYANLRSISLLSPAAVKNFMPFNKKDIVIEKPNRLPANLFNFNKISNMEKISAEEVFEAFKKLSKSI